MRRVRRRPGKRGAGPFVCEVDESDGSIALYNPSVGVLLNVSEDHKPMSELQELFGGFASRAGRVVLGIDSEPVTLLADQLDQDKAITVSMRGPADLTASNIERHAGGLRADIAGPRDEKAALHLPLIGAFNVGNALAAIAAASLTGIAFPSAVAALSDFQGSARRLQTIGTEDGITVIDDFAHNPDKISASVKALAHHYDRLHLLYQPHGYGPLAKFRRLYEDAFSGALRPEDQLFISAPAYFGGTVTKTDDAEKLVETVAARGCQATYLPQREAFSSALQDAKRGDAVVVMGARDDSLTTFARSLYAQLGEG